VTALDLREAESVRHWFASAKHDTAPAEAQERMLVVLDAFCRQTGMSPDDLAGYCFLRKKDTGKRFVSVKRRVSMNEWIDQLVAAEGWEGKEAVVNANVIRGFLIHNGVAIQGPVWKGS
jgi:hypothetical protein